MAKLNPREVAQAAALRGEIDEAVAQLSALQESDTAAHAALAEISAFRGRWQDVLQHVSAVLVEPLSVDTFNVYGDMVRLAALVGVELGDWAEIERIANEALAVLQDVELPPSHIGAVTGLVRFAQAEGKVDSGWRPGGMDDRSEAERIAKYESSIEKIEKRKKQFESPHERFNHYVAIARNCRHYGAAVLLYEEHGLPDLFSSIIFVASALARAGRPDEAWEVIRSGIGRWWPVEDVQIAPMVLLSDEALRPLMTSSRCEEVLRAPRGPGVD
ncbi:MAG: hypothetical protein AB1Z98_20965 [Nannocystaceae bacterium]